MLSVIQLTLCIATPTGCGRATGGPGAHPLGGHPEGFLTSGEQRHKDEVYMPILLEDEDGVVHGNDWVRGEDV